MRISLIMILCALLSTLLLSSTNGFSQFCSPVKYHRAVGTSLHQRSPPPKLEVHISSSSASTQRKLPAPLHIVKLLRSSAIVLVAFLSAVLSRATKAAADIKGIDMYGRVPHDDWLFRTSSLIDSGLLKQSIVEAVQRELPEVLGTFRRRKRIDEALLVFKAIGWGAAAFMVIALIYKFAMLGALNKIQDAYGGRSISAVSKKVRALLGHRRRLVNTFHQYMIFL